MSVKNSRLPVVFCKVPGQPAIEAGIVGSTLDGQNGSVRQSFAITFDDGRQMLLAGFKTSGLIAKHTRGVGPEGAKKIKLNSASNLADLRFFILFPKTGYVRPVKGETETTEKNGLAVVKYAPMLHNNPALTEIGDCQTIATFAQANPPKAKAAKAGDTDTADYGIDDTLILELLGIMEKRDAVVAEQPAEQPATTGEQPAEQGQPLDGQPAEQPA